MENRHRELVQHKGKTVIVHNYVGLSGQEYVDAVEYNGRASSDTGGRDLLVLINVTDSIVDKAVIKAFKRVSKNASASLSKTAVVGGSGIQRMFIKTVASFSKLNIGTFDNLEDAKDWLTS